jgi:hypothetical protein
MLVMNYIKNCKEVILRPSDFYRRMPTTGGYADPLTFAAISIIVGLLLKAILSYGMFIFGVHSRILTFGSIPVSRFDFSIFSNMIELFFMSIVGIFVGSLLLNFLYMALDGTGSYEGTLRFVSYGFAINLLSWIPLLGLIAGIYALYICIVGGSFVHNMSIGRSAIIVVLLYPVTIMFIIFIVGSVAFICT